VSAPPPSSTPPHPAERQDPEEDEEQWEHRHKAHTESPWLWPDRGDRRGTGGRSQDARALGDPTGDAHVVRIRCHCSEQCDHRRADPNPETTITHDALLRNSLSKAAVHSLMQRLGEAVHLSNIGGRAWLEASLLEP